jgi:hypothetical protein
MSQDYPIVDGHACSWADIKVEIAGASDGDSTILDIGDIAAIKWSRKLEVGVQKRGGKVRKRTRGELSQEASITLYRDGFLKLITALAAAAPQRGNQRIISVKAYNILVQHTPYGDTAIYTTKIKGCRYMGESDDMKEGSEADKLEVTLNPAEVANVLEDGTEVVLL